MFMAATEAEDRKMQPHAASNVLNLAKIYTKRIESFDI